MGASLSQTPVSPSSGPLAFEVDGQGPDLICIHGLASARTAWNPIVELLTPHFRVWRVDLPGHGHSPQLTQLQDASPTGLASQLREFAAAQGIHRPHLAGNSLGGFIALEWARQELVSSVTALCPAGLWRPLPGRSRIIEFNQRSARTALPLIGPLTRPAWLRSALMSSASERARRIDRSVVIDAIRAQAQAQGYTAAYQATLLASFDPTAPHPISPKTPVTIAFGDRDRILPAPRNQRRDRAPAHARWEVLYDCGHVPMWDVPRVSASLIRETAQRA